MRSRRGAIAVAAALALAPAVAGCAEQRDQATSAVQSAISEDAGRSPGASPTSAAGQVAGSEHAPEASANGAGNGDAADVSAGAIVPAVRPAGASRPQLLLLLDASGSMKRIGPDGRSSMAAAKRAMTEAIADLPENTSIGLRIFGARVDGHNQPTPAACRDSELVLPITPLEPTVLTDRINATRPLGETPIALSLELSRSDFAPVTGAGSRTILLVTDGEESCHRDPCAVAAALEDEGINVTVNTVGLGVNGSARAALTCIAQATSGQYYDAPTSNDLRAAISDALATLAGRPLASGSGTTSNGLPGTRGTSNPATSILRPTSPGQTQVRAGQVEARASGDVRAAVSSLGEALGRAGGVPAGAASPTWSVTGMSSGALVAAIVLGLLVVGQVAKRD